MLFYAKLVINLIVCNYFFGILTYGCNCDNAPSIFMRLCSDCGITPDYVNAIYLTDGEANRHARYRNRHVTLQDIINANNQL